ncbi:unnamed protein product, partial [Mesorhabditis spiculigera]
MWPLDPESLLNVASADDDFKQRIRQMPKYWETVDTVFDGYIIDYHFVTFADASILLKNATIARENKEYLEQMPVCRRIQDMPLELLRIVADGLDHWDYFSALKAVPRFIHTGRYVTDFALSRVTVRGIPRADGTKETQIKIDHVQYDAQTTAWLLGRAEHVFIILFDPTITEFPDVRLPCCETWKLLPVETDGPTWPGLVDKFKKACRRTLHLRGHPYFEAGPCWASLLQQAGATDKRLMGWVSVEVKKVGVEHLPYLLPFNGPKLTLTWSPRQPPEDHQALWHFIEAAIAMPLGRGQRIKVNFVPELQPETLSPQMFVGIMMNEGRGRDDDEMYWIIDNDRAFSIHIDRRKLRVQGEKPRRPPRDQQHAAARVRMDTPRPNMR